MSIRTACMGIVAVTAIAALIILFYASGAFSTTGAITTDICPSGSTPVISGEVFMSELNDFERRGFYCFFGYDGITPCCRRQ